MLQEIIANIFSGKMRFTLSSIGIGWGVLILVVLIGVGKGLEDGIFNLFKGFAVNSIYVLASKTTLPYRGNPAGQQILFAEDDLDMLKNNIPSIISISPEASTYQNVSTGDLSADYEIKGVYPEYFNMKLLETGSGRTLNHLDESGQRKVILIGSNVAEMFFDGSDPVGKHLTVGNNVYMVVGVIRNTLLNNTEERQIYMPYSVHSTTFGFAGKFPILAFTYSEKSDFNVIKQRFKEFMGRKYHFSPQDDRAFFFSSVEEQVKAFNSLFDTIKTFLWFIGISTLVGGVIGVANIMYASARERTYEIGIRKAVGARKSEIRWMFIGESVITTFFAGMAGMALGFAILKTIGIFIDPDKMLLEKPGLNLVTSAMTMLILMICGTLAGLRPAIYATNLQPIDSLRKES
ncbi:MAG: ABC transporter permease [Tannerella sp.]|jgi:putative ABC transport system permease protein|nr:ABC transporter permease [Tannerella sp.]